MEVILASIAGGISGMAISWAMGFYGHRLRGGNVGRDPLVMNEGRVHRGNGSGGPATPKPDIVPKPQPTGGRLYKGGLYRIKGSDIWYPVGTEPNWTELAHDQVRLRTPNPPPMELRAGGFMNPGTLILF